MLQGLMKSWWFWVSIFIIFWPLNFIFWQNIKKGSRSINTFLEEWDQLYKYPFSRDYVYDIMSVLSFPALLFYVISFVFIFVITRLAEPFLWTWDRIRVDFKARLFNIWWLGFFIKSNPNKTRRHKLPLSCTMFTLWKIQFHTF